MLTRQGVVVTGAAVAAALVGRVFGVVELFVIAAALAIAVAFSLAYVTVRRPAVEAGRWVHPTVLAAGDTGRVDIHMEHRGGVRSAAFTLTETVCRAGQREREARLDVKPMAPRSRSVTGYRLPTSVRGLVELGPLAVELRDPLGIAQSTRGVAGLDEVIVAPRTLPIDMPEIGQGTVGAALLRCALRLGQGEFHGLREYVPGDEPRSIHWRASARTDTLVVRQHSVEGLHRCTVLLDVARASYRSTAGFEQAVTAAASIVAASAREGLTTRFATSDGLDLRGPEVVGPALRALAKVAPSDLDGATLARDTGDGLGLVIVVSGMRMSAAWSAAQAVGDPASTMLAVVTEDAAGPGLAVAGRSDDELVRSWRALVGRGPARGRARGPAR